MSQQAEYYKQAELALAVYGNFATNEPTRQELVVAEFSETQADAFILKYRSSPIHRRNRPLSNSICR